MFSKNIKAFSLTVLAVLFGLDALAQKPGFVQTDVIKVSGVTTNAQVNALALGSIQTTRVFVDGLGRPVQTVALQASPVNNKDIVQPEVYNTLGQQTVGYLPYTDNSTVNPIGSFRTTAVADQLSYYQNSGTTANPNKVANETTYPFSQRVFENSPLQRILKAGMTGSGFQPGVSGNHYKVVSYRLNNNAQDGNIMIWSTSGVFASTYYADNLLYVTDGIDEDNVEARSYSDAAGRVILKRQIVSGSYLDTYYIYNTGGLVSYIIPPLALNKMVTSADYNLGDAPVNVMIFVFTYDGLGRLIEKTVPAKGKVSIVYDPLNRPVLMQDANMLAKNQWNYIRYDVKGRAISQGIYVDATHLGRSAMQTYVSSLSYTTYYESRNTTQSTGYYTANVFPSSGTLTPLSYAYFDDYKLNPSGTAYSYVSQGLTNEETATTAPVKGLPTMIRKTTVGSGLTNVWLLSVTFYDKRLNPIQTQSNNQLYYTLDVLTDYKTSVPDFTGVPQTGYVKKVTGTAAGTTVTVQTNLSYDYMYRIKTVTQNYNGAAAVTIGSYTYNEMGQLVKKGLGLVSGTTFLQNLDMRYNIRGMLTSINNSTLTNDTGTGNTNGDTNDTFGMTLLYDQTDSNLGNTASFSGRVSGVKWMSVDGTGNKSYERAFRYYYDSMGRDTAAIYSERSTPGTGTFSVTHGWDEDRITYDQGGNIKTLYRNSSTQGSGGHTSIDNLTYTYSSTNPNQLSSVSDAAGSSLGFLGGTGTYAYDVNGNLTNEPYKGIAKITYNYLNKTDSIKFSTSVNRFITYTYDAGGSLIRKQQYDNISGVLTLQKTTDYIDGFIYLGGTLSYFPMPEGRVINTGSGGTLTFAPEYIISDQQGNARVSFQNIGGVAKVQQENSYYAFGMIMPGSSVGTPGVDNKHLYNGGSEWQNDYSNLPDYYQTFYRNYDAALGRWVGVDPEAESAESLNPYQYAGNNPVMFNDPLGNRLMPNPMDNPPISHPYVPYDMFANADAVNAMLDPNSPRNLQNKYFEDLSGGNGDAAQALARDARQTAAMTGGASPALAWLINNALQIGRSRLGDEAIQSYTVNSNGRVSVSYMTAARTAGDDAAYATTLTLHTVSIALDANQGGDWDYLGEKSFGFKKIGGKWRGARVTDLTFSVEDVQANRTYSSTFSIEVGVPIKSKNGTFYSAKDAAHYATLTANVVAVQASWVAKFMGPGGREMMVNDATLPYLFAAQMQMSLNKYIPGATVTANTFQYNVVERQAVWVNFFQHFKEGLGL